jgi:hypothetical protein
MMTRSLRNDVKVTNRSRACQCSSTSLQKGQIQYLTSGERMLPSACLSKTDVRAATYSTGLGAVYPFLVTILYLRFLPFWSVIRNCCPDAGSTSCTSILRHCPSRA